MLLIFSRNVGLSTWQKIGNLSREIKLYNELINKKIFTEISFFTFDAKDKDLSENLKENFILSKKINVYSPPVNVKIPLIKELFDLIYFIIIFFRISKKINIIKTNQIDGCYLAVILKIIFRKKLYLRSGYNIIKRDRSIKLNKFRRLINLLQFNLGLKFSDQISVSNIFDKRYYNIIKNRKVNLIYNFVDNKKFYDFKIKRNGKFLYIGRISYEKKVDEIIKLFNNETRFHLDLFGQRETGVKKISIPLNNKNINFYEAIPNNEVPKLLNEYSYLILNSKFEGLSKIILESLSCGIFCVASNLIENRFLIKNDINGYIFNNIADLNLDEIMYKENKLKKTYKTYNLEIIDKYFIFEKYFDNEIKILKKLSFY